MEDDAVDYVRQILEALQFMHKKKIVHLDLKVNHDTVISSFLFNNSPIFTSPKATNCFSGIALMICSFVCFLRNDILFKLVNFRLRNINKSG